MLRLLGLAIALLALLVAACGGDDTDDAAVAEYEAAVAEIIRGSAAEIDELAAPLQEAFTFGSEATQLATIQEVLPEIAAARERTLDELEALDPPESYEADHARYLEGERADVALLRRIVDAAAANDVVGAQQVEVELDANRRATLNALSAEFVALAYADEGAALFAQIAGGLSEEEQAYVEQLGAGAREFARRVQAFGSAVQRSYPNAEGLLRALADAGAGEAVQAAYDVVIEIEPPDSLADDHALVVSYYEQAVEADRRVGEATREADAAKFLIANDDLGRAGAPAIFEVAPAICNVLFAQPLCSAAIDLPEGQYERELRFAFRDLSVGFSPPAAPWGSFDLLPAGSDDELFEAVAVLGPRAIEDVEQARGRVAALEPPSGFEVDHERLLAYLDEVLAAQQAIVAAAEAGDGDAMRAGILSSSDARCDASRDLSASVRPAVGFYFGPEPGELGVCSPA